MWISQDRNGRIDKYEHEPMLSSEGDHWIASEGTQEVYQLAIPNMVIDNWKHSLIDLEMSGFNVLHGVLYKVDKKMAVMSDKDFKQNPSLFNKPSVFAIIEIRSPIAFAHEVNNYLHDGWELYGYPSYGENGYMQAMTKND